MGLYQHLLRFASSYNRVNSRLTSSRNKRERERQKKVAKKIRYSQTKRYGQKPKAGFKHK